MRKFKTLHGALSDIDAIINKFSETHTIRIEGFVVERPYAYVLVEILEEK